jgi:hypothetical protein
MGIGSFFKKLFMGEEDNDPELKVARARHNIDVGESREEKERRRREEAKKYDPWEEVDNMRRNFFIGSWAARKFRVVGEDKLKADLAKIEREREEKRRKKE